MMRKNMISAAIIVLVCSLAACGGAGGGTNKAGASLVSLAVTPTNPSIAKGTTKQFTATGAYSDNTTADLTASVTWSSSDTSRATISSSGLAIGTGVGSAAITATLGSISGTTTLTVTAATLVSIAVTPTNPSIPKGTTKQFTATGVFSDNSIQDLTAQTTWSSSDTAKATVTNAGLAIGVGVGSATITAASGNISGSTTLTVTTASLVSITVTPADPSIAKGTTKQFIATGTYSDNSARDMTSSVTWNSSDMTKATIGNAGLASGTGVGSATITAVSGAVSGTTTLTVTAATLVSITVTPSAPGIALGLTQQFTATGTYTDNTTQNLTASATWSSSNVGVAAVSNASGSQGLATSVSVGSTTVTALDPATNISGTAALIVTNAALVSIAVTPANPSITLGTARQFTATGTYSDNSQMNLTAAVTWNSSNTNVAAISNAAGSNGLVTALAVGTATITAASGLVSSSTTLTITSAIKLPKTGQTTSYAAGDPTDLRGVAWPKPRFTNLNGTTPVTDSAVVDQLTGLMWAWSGNAPGPAACNPAVTKTWQGSLDYVACLNANSFLGYTDWRLPNRNELMSLVDYSQPNIAAGLNSQGFGNVQAAAYWSSTTNSANTAHACYVSMSNGLWSSQGDKTYVAYVWPVRTGQGGAISLPKTGQVTSYYAGDDGALQMGVTVPNPRFTNPNGTTPFSGSVAVDQLTGLMWTQDGGAPSTTGCSYGGWWTNTRQDALDYVACLNYYSYLGYTDWRLPNINELSSFLGSATWMTNQGFGNVQAGYWSSTSYAPTAGSFWCFYTSDTAPTTYSVWPVRGGQ